PARVAAAPRPPPLAARPRARDGVLLRRIAQEHRVLVRAAAGRLRDEQDARVRRVPDAAHAVLALVQHRQARAVVRRQPVHHAVLAPRPLLPLAARRAVRRRGRRVRRGAVRLLATLALRRRLLLEEAQPLAIRPPGEVAASGTAVVVVVVVPRALRAGPDGVARDLDHDAAV